MPAATEYCPRNCNFGAGLSVKQMLIGVTCACATSFQAIANVAGMLAGHTSGYCCWWRRFISVLPIGVSKN